MKISCKICNEELDYINSKHLKKHNITIEEYMKLYYNSKKCKYCGSQENLTLSKNQNCVFPKKICINCIKTYKNDILNKLKKTNLCKTGFEFPTQNKKTMDKLKKTNIDKYGVNNVFKSDKIKEKIKKTLISKYGVTHNSKSSNNYKKYLKTKKDNYWNTFNILLKNKNINPLYDKNKYMLENNDNSYKCQICNNDFICNTKEIRLIRCPICKKKYGSIYEQEISEWLNTLGGTFTYKNNYRCYYDGRKFKEIDVYFEKLNFGIEFNGNWIHSELNKHKNYHQEKYLFFKERNIDIINIFEYEWLEKKELIKSMIKNKLGLITDKIYARKCEIKNIDNKEYKEFLLNNHIQGFTGAKIKIGLYYKNELVSLISLGKPRFNKEYNYEVIRSCTKQGKIVIGGFSKLLKHISNIINNESIISYVNLNYFNGNSYLNNGFKFKNISSPNYIYFKKDIVKSRYETQKHKLKNVLDNFNCNVSEKENMNNNGWLRLYDAGTMTLIKG